MFKKITEVAVCVCSCHKNTTK